METSTIVGMICIAMSFFLEMGSYYKQIAKTLRTGRSAQVSSSAFILKIAKYIVTLMGLAIFGNWVAFGLEIGAFLICSWALWIVIIHKPKTWRWWK